MHTTQTERERVEALAERIYREPRPFLLRIAERNSLNRANAEEALQEAFIAFIRCFDPRGEAPALAWLTLVLKRACWERSRAEQLDHRVGQEADLLAGQVGAALELIKDNRHGREVLAELAERVGEVRARLAELKPQERRALSLLAFGLSYREIGALTGWTHAKVNRCVAEGRAALRAAGAGE